MLLFWFPPSASPHTMSVFDDKMEFLLCFSLFPVPYTQVRFLRNRKMASGRKRDEKEPWTPNWWGWACESLVVGAIQGPHPPALMVTPEKCLCFHSSREKHLSQEGRHHMSKPRNRGTQSLLITWSFIGEALLDKGCLCLVCTWLQLGDIQDH